MSQKNPEIGRRAYDAANAFLRGEQTGDAAAEAADPQVEWDLHAKRTFPDEPQQLRGAPAIIGFWEQMRSAWDELVFEPLEFIEAPGDRIRAILRQSGRGRKSGVPISIHAFVVWTIRDGKVFKTETFRHRADALKAAGLSG